MHKDRDIGTLVHAHWSLYGFDGQAVRFIGGEEQAILLLLAEKLDLEPYWQLPRQALRWVAKPRVDVAE